MGADHGAPFGKEYVHWSKGEYINANQFQNDLTLIVGQAGTVADDAGNTIATAASIDTQVTGQKGLIEPMELSGATQDVDYYEFTLLSAADTQIEISPLVTVDAQDEQYGTNLSTQATLLNSIETPIAVIEPTYDPITNRLIYDASLDAGTYYLKIEAKSPNLSWSTGFGEYGDGRIYRLSLNVEDQPVVPGVVNQLSPEGNVSDSTPE